jgi:hypothetical protein
MDLLVPATGEKPNPTLRWWHKPYTALTLLVLLGAYLPLALRAFSEWEDVYIAAARRLVAGEPLFNHSYCYLPFGAFLAVPFVELPVSVGRCIWFGCNAAALVTLVWAAWRTAGGGCLERPGTPRREHIILALGLLLGFRFAWNSLAHQQTDVLIGAFLMMGCWALVCDRPWLSAILLGISASIKAVPLGWAGYLLWRGHKGPALALVLVTLGLNLLPELVARPTGSETWLQVWLKSYGSSVVRSDVSAGQWYSTPIYNQSVAGMCYRFNATSWVQNDEGRWHLLRRPGTMDRVSLRMVVLGVQGLIAVAVLVCIGRPRWRAGTLAATLAPGRFALECSAITLVMLLLSPMSGKAHFGVLLLPAFCLTRLALAEKRPFLVAVILLASLLNLSTMKGVVGGAWADGSLWLGVVTWQTILLLAGCCYGLIACRPALSLPKVEHVVEDADLRQAA